MTIPGAPTLAAVPASRIASASTTASLYQRIPNVKGLVNNGKKFTISSKEKSSLRRRSSKETLPCAFMNSTGSWKTIRRMYCKLIIWNIFAFSYTLSRLSCFSGSVRPSSLSCMETIQFKSSMGSKQVSIWAFSLGGT